MADENIFDGVKPSEEEQTTVQETNTPEIQIPEEVSDLIGEGKKYGDVTTALKALKAAQEHIANLEQENGDYRTKVSSFEEQQTEIEQLKNDFKTMLNTSSESDQTTETSPTDTQGSGSLDNSQIEALVAQQLNQREREAQANANLKQVIDAATNEFGSEASTKFYETGKAWGYTQEEMNKLAASKPNAVLKMLNVKQDTKHFNTNNKRFSQQAQPQPPSNWGSDAEVIRYMQEKRKAIAAKHNLV